VSVGCLPVHTILIASAALSLFYEQIPSCRKSEKRNEEGNAGSMILQFFIFVQTGQKDSKWPSNRCSAAFRESWTPTRDWIALSSDSSSIPPSALPLALGFPSFSVLTPPLDESIK
jgi:hypothetical protein